MSASGAAPPHVAVFTDTFDDVNGVSTIYRQFVMAANAATAPAGRLSVFTLSDRTAREAGPNAEVLRYRPRPRLTVPGYPDLHTGYPPRSQMAADFAARSFDAVVVATPGPVGFLGLSLARRAGLPVIGFYHTRFPAYLAVYARGLGSARYVPTMAERVGFRWMQQFYGPCGLVLCQSATLGGEVRQATAAPIAVWDTGVDLSLFAPGKVPATRERFGIPPEAVVVAYVGRLAPEKGLELLIPVARALPELPFLVVGDGPYAATLQAETRAILTGFLRGEALADAYRASDVFLFPSTTDTFGNVLLEAMASGLALVVAESGPGGELVARTGAGLTFPAGNWEAAREALARLAANPELRRRMAERGLAHAGTRDWPVAFERFVALCVQARRPRRRPRIRTARRRIQRMAVRLSRSLTATPAALDYPRRRGGPKERQRMLECLECGAELAIHGKVGLGDLLTCEGCSEAFIVVEVSPLEIDYPDEDETWDEDWDGDWDGEDDPLATDMAEAEPGDDDGD